MPTERDLQNLFYKHNWRRYDLVGVNIFVDSGSNEMDILGLRRSGYVDEIEIKLNAKDYRAEFEKTIRVKREDTDNGYPLYDKMLKHDALERGITNCNYYWFLMPESLASTCDIPEYAGILIYYIDNAGIERIKHKRNPTLLHKRKLSEKKKYEAAKKMATRYWRYK